MQQQKLTKWQRKKSSKLILALACFGLTDLFFSLSIDRGNLLYYLLTLIFLIYFLKYSIGLIGDLLHAILH